MKDLAALYSAYRELSQQRGRISVPIADVIERAGVPVEEAKATIVSLGDKVQLDQGEWSSSTEAQRAAVINAFGRHRLYMAFTEAPAARLDSIQKALAVREFMLKMEADQRVQETIDRSGPYSNPID